VLADEPTGSVDSETGASIMGVLLDWARRRSGTLVLITHDEVLAGSLDRVLRMSDGRVVSTRAAQEAHGGRGAEVSPLGFADGAGIDAARHP